jgi:hypothetical protein
MGRALLPIFVARVAILAPIDWRLADDRALNIATCDGCFGLNERPA